MVFAIEEINQSSSLLPNITLGFHISDSCISENRAVKRTLELLSGKNGPVPGYRCPNHPPLAGIVGETFSTLSVPMARILGVLHYPQISHSSVLSTLSDKRLFPSFFRTVPGNTFQNIALARLMGYFSWTWMGMIISDTESGLKGGQDMKRQIEGNGGCVAFMEKIHLLHSQVKVLRLVQMIKNHSASVIIVHSEEVNIKLFLETLHQLNVRDKVWVYSANFIMASGLFGKQVWRILNGSLGLAPYTGNMPGFEEFLHHLHPSTSPDDIFMKHFWEQAFHCRWPQTNDTQSFSKEAQGENSVFCSRDQRLDKQAMSLFELDDLSYTYHAYAAVYALAHSLHTLISCTPGQGPFVNRTCANINDIRSWQILHYMKNQPFQTASGEKLIFDANGDAPATYLILNVQISPDEEFQLIKVGKLDPKASEGNNVHVSKDTIRWKDGSSKVPLSVCSESCPPGYRKAAREGQPLCCFDCVPCSQGEISNGNDTARCQKCPDEEWSNERNDECIKKVVEFLSYEELLGLTLAITAGLLSFLTASVLCVFIKYRDTPIVKANNRGLSYLLLIALMCCFLCSFIFIGRPRKLTCMLRQMVFGIIFTLSVSSILAKTIIVVIAFKATNPNSSARKWIGSTTPSCTVIFCSLVQVCICCIWLIQSPPFPEFNMKSDFRKIIFECNEGHTVFFYCMLGYMGLLATVSFVVAFLSRNLPGSFNEAKLITFSMLVFVSVWISFIPAYLSTRGKYMVAVEVFAILCSSAGLLGCIFFPKCYIILLRPDRNTRQHLVGKDKLGHKKGE
ncbi:extracellular calcium-sensing receptor-like [Lissotriton helveticus]